MWDWIDASLPSSKRGTLRIWGNWFGRPYDNFHIPRSCQPFEGGLRFIFNDDELLTIWQPNGVVLNETTFEIADAVRVRWDWYWYGSPKIPSNLKHLDYVRVGDCAELTSNADYVSSPQFVDTGGPAAELL